MVFNRKNRYLQKISYIQHKLDVLPNDCADELVIDAIFYRVQTSIEFAMDIIAMLKKDLGFIISDDYSNIENLINNNIFSKSFGNKLKSLNGLGNTLVHRYNAVDFSVISENISQIKDILFEFCEVISNLLPKIFE